MKQLTKKERKEKEREDAESAKTNSKNFWKHVNSKRKSKSGISELRVTKDNKTEIASSDAEKAEVLVDFFTSVFTNKNVDEIPTFAYVEYSQHSSDELFTTEEIRKLLLSLNTTKSPGPDRVHS